MRNKAGEGVRRPKREVAALKISFTNPNTEIQLQIQKNGEGLHPKEGEIAALKCPILL